MPEQSKKETKPTIEEFVSAYSKLCEDMGFKLEARPVWVLRDDSTFSMRLEYYISEIPKK